MQYSAPPSKITTAFATGGTKNTIPASPGSTAGTASYSGGFPSLNWTAPAAGGVPPYGPDFNGVLYDISAIQRWQSAGGLFAFDATFAAANTGYPKGAILVKADASGIWFNLADANAVDPATSATNWYDLVNGSTTRTFSVGPASASTDAVNLGVAQSLLAGIGQCRLSVASATSLLLSPYNGNRLTINGTTVMVPAAGAALSSTGLQASVATASYSVTSNVVTYVTAAAHGLSVGSRVYLENTALGANGSYVVTAVASTTSFSFAFTNANVASTTDTSGSAQPVYYAYASYSGTTLSLSASQIGYTMGGVGIATMTGDVTKTLVGMFMVNSSGFIDSTAYRWCLNWFNRRPRRAAKTGGPISVSQQTNGVISSTLHARFLMWSDDVPLLNYSGTLNYAGSSPSATAFLGGLCVDNTNNSIAPVFNVSLPSSYSYPVAGNGVLDAAVAGSLSPNEGGHVAILAGYVGANGGTVTLNSYQCDVSIWG